MRFVMFSKMLKRTGGLSVDEAGDRIAKLGFDGVDLTVRPGGHVAPEDASQQLSGAIETFRSKGLSVPMITTGITDADEEYAEDIFAVADAEDVEYLKLGYWYYDGFGSIHEGCDSMREDLEGIRELSTEYDVTPAVHTHSGDFLSANPAMLWSVLRDGKPEDLGIYVDPGHLVAEGSLSGWEMNLDLVRDYVAMVSIKDFGWSREQKNGEVEWMEDWVPLGEGLVPWDRVFDRLDAIGFDGPVSVHSEYGNLDLEGLIDQTREDVEYLDGIVERRP
jgi:sugar phosphate isomerase/epimerase